jgi:hypothetical protein
MMRLLHPLPGARVTQRFGEHPDWYEPAYEGHEGIDYSAVVGTPVRAAHDGTAYTRMSSGYGTHIELMGAGMRTVYAHLSEVLRTGPVKAGDVIALTGNTGRTTGPHLHFGVCPLPRDWVNGFQGYVDPELWLESEQEVTMAPSKLGVHYQNNPELGTEATELVRDSGIRWVKGIDPDYWPTPPRDMFPRQQVLARLWIGGDAVEAEYANQGADGANLYVARLQPRYLRLLNEGVKHFLGPNELHPTAATIRAHVAFWRRWAESIVAMGGIPWFGSFGVGWPDVGQIAHYAAVARYCAEHGGGMEVHEYGAPSVMDGDGWWTLRYRRTIAELGFEVPVFVGECGIDWGVVPGQTPSGWQSHKSYVYPPQYGLGEGVMNEERFWRQLSAYDDELCKDGYVVAATPFVTCPTSDWATFDFGGSLIRRVVAKHNTNVIPPIEPPVEPPVTPPAAGPTDEAIRNAAWSAVGVPYNPNAAFPVYAREHGLGAPLAGESDLGNVRLQPFMGGVVCATIGDWGNVRVVAW